MAGSTNEALSLCKIILKLIKTARNVYGISTRNILKREKGNKHFKV